MDAVNSLYSKTATRLQKSFSSRQLFFIIATLISVIVSGYHFGTFDQAAHIPFVKKFADPSLYPTDPFLGLAGVHYSFFWRFFVPFEKLGILERIMFVVHLLSTYLTFAMIWRLSTTLFKKPGAALLAILFFIVPHLGFGGLSVVEFSLLNRTFVLPILLYAIDLYLKEKVTLSFLILGLAYNIHAISVHFVLALFTIDLLIRYRIQSFRKLILGGIVFIAAASPLLIWRFGSGGLDFAIRPAWFQLVSDGLLRHLLFPFGGSSFISVLTLSGISSTILFFILRKHNQKEHYDKQILNFITASLGFVIVSYLFSYLYPAVFIIQLQLIRAGIFILIFAYLYLANYLATQVESKSKFFDETKVVILSAIILPLPLLVLPILTLSFVKIPSRLKLMLISLATLVFFVLSMYVLSTSGIWQPGIYLSGKNDSWKEAAYWARDNTSKETRFITPPHLWSLNIADWRVLSERPSVVTYSEILELIFEPKYLASFEERLDAVSPGARAQFQGDFFKNRQIISRSFYSLSSEKLTSIAKRFGATYIVIEKPHQLSLPKVFENEGFIIYGVSNP